MLSISLLCALLAVPLMRNFSATIHAASSISLPPGPVSKTWYFAEGRVGNGFQQFFTLDNPDANADCMVNLQYLYTLDNTSTAMNKTMNVRVNHATRWTQHVNDDLRIQPTQKPGATVSTIVSVDINATPACKGIVAERPMYFTFHNVKSGSDVLGATSLTQNAYFADVETQNGAISFLTILNPPGGSAAKVAANYYSGGKLVDTQNVSVAAGTRFTITPGEAHVTLPQHVVVVVTSDQPIVVERPSYFSNIAEGNAGVVSSASSVVGASSLAKDLLFAEGYTGGKFQENLLLANVNAPTTSATIKLEYNKGHTQTINVSIPGFDQTIIDVNKLADHAMGTCDTNPCITSAEVSAEITTANGIVAERQMFFGYSNGKNLTATGGTDVIGEGGLELNSTYSFAEGYVNAGYNEWLTLQNPTANAENIYVTVVNGYGRSYTQAYNVPSVSRNTVDITALVEKYLVQAGDGYRGYEVSMTVQTLNKAVFSAERPMYWNTTGSTLPTQGGSDVIGYGSSMTQSVAWSGFDGNGQRSGVNTTETLLSSSNAGNLTRLWQQTLPATVDGTVAELPGVTTASGVKDLLFVTTKSGSLLAIDAVTGSTVWSQGTHGPNYTTSSPAIDPSGQFVYGYGLDGKAHKYAVSSGAEIVSGGWPAIITLMPNVEKGSSALNVGNGYLYVTTGGYPGDGGHYQGHVVAVNLSTASTTIFNSLCANIRQLLDGNSKDSNYCPDVQSGIWSRGGVVIDPVTGNVFITTGNGLYTANTGGHDYGDSVVELSPDLTRLIDTYTPTNFATLRQNDQDLGSAAPAMLPPQAGSTTPYMAVQGGKDNMLRLINRQNLSGQGGPNHVGGSLQAVSLPQGGDIFTHPTVWNDANGVTWVFVANDSGLSAFKVVTDAKGHSTLQLAYSNKYSGSSPFIANGVMFLQASGTLYAMVPTTAAVLWNSGQGSAGGSIGSLHWQSPTVVNGRVYVPDNDGHLTAYGLHS